MQCVYSYLGLYGTPKENLLSRDLHLGEVLRLRVFAVSVFFFEI